MPYFDGARGRLHYRRWPVENPVSILALLPGTGQHSGHYHRFARALQPAGIELWTLDASGHGLSEGDPDRPGTLPELSDDARVFLDLARIASATPPVLMGHSLGAATALAVLTGDPDPRYAGVILCGTPAAVLEGRAPKSARGTGIAPRGASARSAAPVTAGGRAASADARKLYPGTEPALPKGIPALIVHGVDDRRAPIAPVREWARTQHADFREYADAGHDLLHEPVHAEVSAQIAAWVNDLRG
ncbi:alpha/beta hydrolase [Nocardia huaxiensis]|uniref:Alpha/beta hydrolase n=1 Tax=Nocardia huaxiensis TaxID=2755382 RepID=A0A7D7A0C6_9NOCA|nr:alpha/beta hydrolase [Nocardia huaxiensis]QLY32869.1 alpha/beta hydrolase [Nocardia huaxiensis]